MSNYIEYKDTVAFHPGYYIKELIDESGLTQEDFAKRLGTTPKNLSVLVRGEQSLSVGMATKLSKMFGTSAAYWLNLQAAFDAVRAEASSDEDLEEERVVLRSLGYGYFRDNFGLPNLPRKLNDQVEALRCFLGVSSLTVLRERNMAVSFRGAFATDDACIARANAMVQIATNMALRADAPRFDKAKFEQAVLYALSQTSNHEGFYPLVREAFMDAGVVFVILPNLSGSKTNGATKKVGSSIMLMVNDRRCYADSFWFTLLHEIGHVMNGDFGISFECETGEREDAADEYARDMLIDSSLYESFVKRGRFTLPSVEGFARSINRDPGIVLGRLQNDGHIAHGDPRFASLKRRYKVVMGLE